jgi:hypothetical protein
VVLCFLGLGVANLIPKPIYLRLWAISSYIMHQVYMNYIDYLGVKYPPNTCVNIMM